MRIHLIAVPFDSARRGERMGAGPGRLLDAGLADRLRNDGHDVYEAHVDPPHTSWRAEIRTAFDLAHGVSDAVRRARAADALPMVLSGNCGPAALGCVAGLEGACSILWFDAHADMNTPETTISGFLDGMALAAATGRCWRTLASRVPGFAAVRDEAVILAGARDLDPPEVASLAASAIRRIPPGELRDALPEALRRAAVAARPAYLHLDLDVLDPSGGRLNAYAAPGGLSRADLEWAIHTIAGTVAVRAVALSSLDPDADPAGRGVDAALALALSTAGAVARHPW